MRPFLTILHDSYRQLQSRTLFWLSLGISLLVAVLYLSVGFNDQGISYFFGLGTIENERFRAGTEAAELLYVGMFTKLIAAYWLSWIAVLLALISCGSIFPDALEEGSAGMVLTKKPSRSLVFVAKFVGSLLFVLIQVVVFVVVVFFALWWRLGSWNPSIFWYVPIILLVFFYLYSVFVLVAVKTKSVMTALIVTTILWFTSSVVGWTEGKLFGSIKLAEGLERLVAGGDPAEVTPVGEASDSLKAWHQRVNWFYAVLPKTGRTMEVADQFVVIGGKKGLMKGSLMALFLGVEDEMSTYERTMVVLDRLMAERHTVRYVIGTSVVFALTVFLLAGWSFCRKEI